MNNNYIIKDGKQLKLGYTTGSCATAASVVATEILLGGDITDYVSINLPNNITAILEIENIDIGNNYVCCSVIKNAGDDPDITHGIKIFAKASFINSGIKITGGKGIGIITEKGLKSNIGEYAINPTPKQMICDNIKLILEKYNYIGGIEIALSVPNGAEVAKKTFNPRLGIKDGISILGTTGIVEPMSEKAFVDTIKVVIDKYYVNEKEKIIIAPGNYGKNYCETILNIDTNNIIKFSNFLGETLDYIYYKGFKKCLLVGHIGKLIKIAGGIMNTHSKYADCRMEIIASHCAMFGADKEFIKCIFDCVTTDSAIKLMETKYFYEDVLKSILSKIEYHINYRLKNMLEIGVIIFGTEDKLLIKSSNTEKLLL